MNFAESDAKWAEFSARLKQETNNLAEPPKTNVQDNTQNYYAQAQQGFTNVKTSQDIPTYSYSYNQGTPGYSYTTIRNDFGYSVPRDSGVNRFPGYSAQKVYSQAFPELSFNKTTTVRKSDTYNAKTIKPLLADINYTRTVDQLKSVSNYLELIQGIEKEVQISLDYYIALQQSDVVEELTRFFKKLDTDQMPLLKNDFVDFWVNRFNNISEPLKTLVTTTLNPTKESFFTQLSDSIGLLINSNCLIDDSTIPFIDYTGSLYTAPNTIPIQMRNKLSDNSIRVSYELSRLNSILMRNNLKRINLPTPVNNPYANPTTPHSQNLITDINTVNIIRDNLNAYYNNLKNSYSRIFSYIEYVSNINNFNGYNPRSLGAETGTNQQIVGDLVFSFDVEKFKISVDILQRKFKNILSYRTNKNVLSNTTTRNEATTPVINLPPGFLT